MKWSTVPKRTRFRDVTFAFSRFGQVFERHRLSSEDPLLSLEPVRLVRDTVTGKSHVTPTSPFLDKEIAVFKSGSSYVVGN